MQVQWSEVTLGDELCVVGRELGELVVQVEAPHVQVGLVGVRVERVLWEIESLIRVNHNR